MSIQPKGEDLRKAVKWVGEERKYNPAKELKALIDEACMKFDLSPMDADFLFRTLLKEEKNTSDFANNVTEKQLPPE